MLTELASLYTFTVYIGSSIYTPAEGDVMRIFGVGHIAASLGLALYVLACQSFAQKNLGCFAYNC